MNIELTDKTNTRFWYLVDGYRTFYLTDLKKNINSLFLYDGDDNDYVGEMLLNKTLQGADALFRVCNGREMSVIDSDGYEYIHQENKWKFRDYNALKKYILNKLSFVSAFYDDLIKYVLFCSKNDTSSIIWVPKDMSTIDDYIITATKNVLTKKPLGIMDTVNLPIVKRLLSSDGVTVIDKNGEIRYFGCIVDLRQTNVMGIKGTGETAAALLAKNGMVIKISQDGPIKVFVEGIDVCVSF